MIRLALVSLVVVAAAVFVAPSATSHADPVSSIPSCAVHGDTSDSFASEIPVRLEQSVGAPPITAQAAVVLDGETGRVLYDLGAHARRPPASTTKIMTALLAVEHGGLDDTVISDVDGSQMIGSSVMGLRPGLPITVRDLLYGLMLPSGNDAALLLAEHDDGSVQAFVEEMNRKAEELGLRDTHFVNPHGLDSREHYSSAYDLARLARVAMQNPEFAKVVSTQWWHLAPPSDYDLHNGNSMLETYPGADGVKIGWTEDAGWTLVASATRDGHRLFAVVLNSTDRDADASALLDWAFGSFQWVRLEPRTLDHLRLAERLGLGMPILRPLLVCA
jgi:D-alanyl-D-alanine carboxypeptidase (penicillin-binding protein 5/6)